jgi:hypothetical protein
MKSLLTTLLHNNRQFFPCCAFGTSRITLANRWTIFTVVPLQYNLNPLFSFRKSQNKPN